MKVGVVARADFDISSLRFELYGLCLGCIDVFSELLRSCIGVVYELHRRCVDVVSNIHRGRVDIVSVLHRCCVGTASTTGNGEDKDEDG